MKKHILIKTAIILFIINGCMPYTSNYPITKKGNIKIDSILIGEWNINSELGIYKILIEPINDKKYLGSYYRIYHENNRLTNTNAGFGYISKINDSEYINAQIAFGDSLTKNKYVFFKVNPINKDSIELFYLSSLIFDTTFYSSKEFANFIKTNQDVFELAFIPVGIATREILSEIEYPVTSLSQSMDFLSPTIYPNEVKSAFSINYDKIMNAKEYLKSIIPNDYTLYVEFINHDNADLWIFKNNGDEREAILQVWDTEISSPEIKNAIKSLGWDNYELIILRELIYNANCISIANYKKFIEVGYQRSGMGKYSYILFDDPIPETDWNRYNDSCAYIMIDSLNVIEYGGGAIGSQCMPLRDKK